MTPAMILMAVQATLKLGMATRQGYVKAAREREMLLPPVGDVTEVTISTALDYFQLPSISNQFLSLDSKSRHPEAVRIKELVTKAKASSLDNSTPEAQELIRYHNECNQVTDLEDGVAFNGINLARLDGESSMAIVSIQAWTLDGQRRPSWWKEYGEALFDTALEIAIASPTICNPATTEGKALAAFLSAVKEKELVNMQASDLLPSFMITTLEVAAQYPGLITGGQRGQKLVHVTLRSLCADIEARLTDPAYEMHRDSIRQWGQLVFRSILDSAGRLAIEDPGSYLGIQGERSGEMVKAVGNSILDVLLKPSTGVADLSALFEGPALEGIAKAALKVVAQYPDIVLDTDNQGLNGIMSAMAKDIAAMDDWDNEMIPELLRLLLENTSENLELVWPDVNSPEKHLFITATKATLHALSQKPADGQWELDFGHADAMEVVQAVFDELKANPAWLVGDSPEINAVLGTVLDQTMIIIRSKGDETLTRGAVKTIISSTLHYALGRVEFPQAFPDETSARTFMAACLEATLAAVFDSSDQTIKYRLARDAGLNALVESALAAVEKTDLGNAEEKKKVLAALKTALTQITDAITAGKGIDLAQFEAALNQAITGGDNA